MLNLKSLEGKHGDAVSLLQCERDEEGVADLSAADWDTALVILNGLDFSVVRVRGVTILPNFVECTIRESEFHAVDSTSHFWGAQNSWTACVFRKVVLEAGMSPENTFTDCVFDEVSLSGYAPHTTIFRGCTFENLSMSGMRIAAPGTLDRAGAPKVHLLFDRCVFRRPRFTDCYFSGTEFRDCEIQAPLAENCDFAGAVSSPQWWTDNQAGDPFIGFLNAVLHVVERRLGLASAAYRNLSQYHKEYTNGETTSKEYFRGLYSSDVPNSERQAIEGELDELEWRHGLPR